MAATNCKGQKEGSQYGMVWYHQHQMHDGTATAPSARVIFRRAPVVGSDKIGVCFL